MSNKNVRRNWGSRTSHLWQSRQSWSVEAELRILGNDGRTEERKRNFRSLAVKTEQKWNFVSLEVPAEMKWTYPYLEVLTEQVRKMNEIFRRPGRAEVRKADFQIIDSKGRAELRKWSFRLLKVLQSGNAEAELQIVGSQGRTEVWKRNFTSTEELAEQMERISCHIIGSQAKWKCGSWFADLWQSCQVWSVEAELYPSDCHCQCWRITLLTAIIVIPNEGQCEDQVWLKHRTFAMLLTRSLYSRRDSG